MRYLRNALVVPVALSLLVACGESEEAVCVRDYSDAIEPLFQRETELAEEYELFLRQAETGDAIMEGSRAELLDRYTALVTEIESVETPCEAVRPCHRLIRAAAKARRTSLERIVAIEEERPDLVALHEEISEWQERDDVARRDRRRQELVENLGPGRRVVLDQGNRFEELREKLAEAAGDSLPEELAEICERSASLMRPLDQADTPEKMVLVLRGQLESYANAHQIVVGRAQEARIASEGVGMVWGEIVDLLEQRQAVLDKFVTLQGLEREIRRLDEELEGYDRLLRERSAIQSRVGSSLREVHAQNRVAERKLDEFETKIRELRARVL